MKVFIGLIGFVQAIIILSSLCAQFKKTLFKINELPFWWGISLLGFWLSILAQSFGVPLQGPVSLAFLVSCHAALYLFLIQLSFPKNIKQIPKVFIKGTILLWPCSLYIGAHFPTDLVRFALFVSGGILFHRLYTKIFHERLLIRYFAYLLGGVLLALVCDSFKLETLANLFFLIEFYFMWAILNYFFLKRKLLFTA